jgi:hypothetical protein
MNDSEIIDGDRGIDIPATLGLDSTPTYCDDRVRNFLKESLSLSEGDITAARALLLQKHGIDSADIQSLKCDCDDVICVTQDDAEIRLPLLDVYEHQVINGTTREETYNERVAFGRIRNLLYSPSGERKTTPEVTALLLDKICRMKIDAPDALGVLKKLSNVESIEIHGDIVMFVENNATPSLYYFSLADDVHSDRIDIYARPKTVPYLRQIQDTHSKPQSPHAHHNEPFLKLKAA